MLNPNAVAYLDETGSGNETAAHLRQLDRMTIMFCGFEVAPLILRLYGHGCTHPVGTPEYEALLGSAFGGEAPPGGDAVVSVWLDPEGAMRRLLGARRTALALVRPDGYLGYRGQPASWEALHGHLNRYLIARP